MSDVASFAVGAVLGDSDAESMAWSRAIGALSTDVKELREGIASPVNVNVIFHVDGRLAPNDFVGVRAGRFDKRRSLLVVQAAVSRDAVEDRRHLLMSLLWEAIAEAERLFAHKGLADGLPEIRRILAAVPGSSR